MLRGWRIDSPDSAAKTSVRALIRSGIPATQMIWLGGATGNTTENETRSLLRPPLRISGASALPQKAVVAGALSRPLLPVKGSESPSKPAIFSMFLWSLFCGSFPVPALQTSTGRKGNRTRAVPISSWMLRKLTTSEPENLHRGDATANANDSLARALASSLTGPVVRLARAWC